ncbi:MAG: response regulator transcription factor [Crocinitomicaceae bacterium]|nr:response regulator transcription factor [Crocinitomicaceae bacterium]
MINCIAIDDEPLALEVISALCEKVPFLHLSHTFTRVSLAQKHLQKFPVELIFLDINMPDMNGITFKKSIRQDVMVVFTTAFSKYAVEGFNVNAIDYLLKPIEYNRFEQACKKVRDNYEYSKSLNAENENYLFVRSEYALVKIPFADINYLETLDDYVKIHQVNKKPVLTLISLKKMMGKLPQNKFVRVHRSYIVSLTKISSVRGKVISVSDVEIPMGSSYRKNFVAIFEK